MEQPEQAAGQARDNRDLQLLAPPDSVGLRSSETCVLNRADRVCTPSRRVSPAVRSQHYQHTWARKWQSLRNNVTQGWVVCAHVSQMPRKSCRWSCTILLSWRDVGTYFKNEDPRSRIYSRESRRQRSDDVEAAAHPDPAQNILSRPRLIPVRAEPYS